jgi:hypothetical protein
MALWARRVLGWPEYPISEGLLWHVRGSAYDHSTTPSAHGGWFFDDGFNGQVSWIYGAIGHHGHAWLHLFMPDHVGGTTVQGSRLMVNANRCLWSDPDEVPISSGGNYTAEQHWWFRNYSIYKSIHGEVTNLAAVDNGGQVAGLSWDAFTAQSVGDGISGSVATGYNIYRSVVNPTTVTAPLRLAPANGSGFPGNPNNGVSHTWSKDLVFLKTVGAVTSTTDATGAAGTYFYQVSPVIGNDEGSRGEQESVVIA